MEILETFLRVFCFPKSHINENGGKTKVKNIQGSPTSIKQPTPENERWLLNMGLTVSCYKRVIQGYSCDA